MFSRRRVIPIRLWRRAQAALQPADAAQNAVNLWEHNCARQSKQLYFTTDQCH